MNGRVLNDLACFACNHATLGLQATDIDLDRFKFARRHMQRQSCLVFVSQKNCITCSKRGLESMLC